MAKRTNLDKRRAAAAEYSSPSYQDKRKSIVDAAARVFQRRGYENTTLGHIAKELETDRATLYYYASSKQELFDEVLRQASEKNLEAVEAIVEGDGSASDKLGAALTQLMETYNSDYPYLHLFMQRYLQSSVPADGDGDGDGMVQRTHDWAARYYTAIRAILQQGVDEGEFTLTLPIGIVAISVIGTVNWVQATGATSPQRRETLGKKALAPSAIGSGLTEMLLKGLRGH